MTTLRVPGAILLLLTLLLATVVACVSDDDDSDDEGDTPSATEQADDSGDDEMDDADDSDDDDGGASDLPDFGDGLVVVTIGDDRYEFDLNEGFNVCRDVFGGLQIAGSGPDDTTKVNAWIPPADWESYDDGRYDPPSIEVENEETNSQWMANQARAEERGIAAGSSQVDSFQIDGLRASGTATFIDTFDFEDPQPVQGTFEIACTE
jgi:hypothetical protein